MNKLKINDNLYQCSKNVYTYFFNRICPILKVIGLIVLGSFLVILPLLSIVYLYRKPGVGLSLVATMTVFSLVIIFIVKCCKSDKVVNETAAISDFGISVPFKLVIFQKELIKRYKEGTESVLDVFVGQHKLGNIPYAYDQGDDIKYIELCLVHDYRQCIKGQGIYQGIYDDLFKVKTTDSSNSLMKAINV